MEFNGVDLSTYGLIVTRQNTSDAEQSVSLVQLPDVAYSFGATKVARQISLEIAVVGTDRNDLLSKLDNIKLALNERKAKELYINTDRYYMAQFVNLQGNMVAPNAFMGNLDFICPDPLAYSATLTSPTFTITGTQIVDVITGGTAHIKPRFTLTASEDVSSVKIENLNLEEALIWTGSLVSGDILTVDVANWVVKKNGTESMFITGQFPRLNPSSTNHIETTGFKGTFKVEYRNVYI